MENNYIWVITNNNGEFIRACATREVALAGMLEWRDSCERIGIFANVSMVDSVCFDFISFEVTDRDGKVCRMNARRVLVD